jgi:hypothetical protein
MTLRTPDPAQRIEPSIKTSLLSKLGELVPVTNFPELAIPPTSTRATPSAAIGIDAAIAQLVVAGNTNPILIPVVPTPTEYGMWYLNW